MVNHVLINICKQHEHDE